jgi:hypothetical protein
LIIQGTTSILKYLNGKHTSSKSSDCSDALIEPHHAVALICQKDAEIESRKLAEVPLESIVDKNSKIRAPTENSTHNKVISDKSANVKVCYIFYCGCVWMVKGLV